jgi:phosphoglycolate phosphatase
MAAESRPYSTAVLLDDVDAVVFDKDGTLIDVHRTWGPAMARALVELVKNPADRQRAAAAIGVDLEVASLTADSPVIAESNGEIAARIATELDWPLAETVSRLEELATRHVGDAVQPLTGVMEMLTALREAGFWIGLATNDGGESAARQLTSLGWREHFDSVIGYDSGFGAKPDPGMLLASAQRAGCSIDRLVMVGDTATDVGAANSAGCRVVVVGSLPIGDAQVTAEIARIGDLPELLGL